MSFAYPELVAKLARTQNLLDAGCPVGRYELSDEEWSYLGRMRRTFEKLSKPKPQPTFDALTGKNLR